MYFDYKVVLLSGFLTILYTVDFCHSKALLKENADSKSKSVYDHGQDAEEYQSSFTIRKSNYYPLLTGQPIYIPNLAQSTAETNKFLENYYKNEAFAQSTTPTTPVQHSYDGKSKYFEHTASKDMLKSYDGANEGGHVDNFHVLPDIVQDLNFDKSNLHDSTQGSDNADDYGIEVISRIAKKVHKYDFIPHKEKPEYEHAEEYEEPFHQSIKNKMSDIPIEDSKSEVVDEYAQPSVRGVLKNEKAAKKKMKRISVTDNEDFLLTVQPTHKMSKGKGKKQSHKLNSEYEASTIDAENMYDLKSNSKSSSNFHKQYQMNEWSQVKYYEMDKNTAKVLKSDLEENSFETNPENYSFNYELPQYTVKKMNKENFADKTGDTIIKSESKQPEEQKFESPPLIIKIKSAGKTDKLNSEEHTMKIKNEGLRDTKLEDHDFQSIKMDNKIYSANSEEFGYNFPDVIQSLTSLHPNIGSLIFNPKAQQPLNLKKCVTNKNEPGFCSYIQHCDVPNIVSSLEQLLNNSCVVDGAFIGVCCPEFPAETIKVQWEQLLGSRKQLEELSLNVKECGIRSKESRKMQSWPWMASLISMSSGKTFCSGGLINEEYVLTAAHCTTKVADNRILVRLGRFDNLTGSDFAVVEIKRHARYDPVTIQNDIALLKLDRKIKFDDHVGSICLYDDGDNDDRTGEKAILLVWKSIFGTRSKDHEVVKVMSNEKCERKLGEKVPSTVLCTKSRKESKGTCNADLGAPLITEDDGKYEVIGILSWNKYDCDQRFPSMFTRVSSYVKWIRKHVN